MNRPVVICALNSSYSHTSLAARSIAAHVRTCLPEAGPVRIIEETIHEPPLSLLRLLTESGAAIFAFSCYIWNISLIRDLCRQLRVLEPQAVIIWGGPEAGSAAAHYLAAEPAVDYIISGEGEDAFCRLLQVLISSESASGQGADENLPSRLTAVPALSWRHPADRQLMANPPKDRSRQEDWPFPYTPQDLAQINKKIVYYESARGCPFACSYCLSSLEDKVFSRPLDKVMAELEVLIEADVLQVKFVDRTFNFRPDRAEEIWNFLLRRYRQRLYRTSFHFEIAGDLLTEKSLQLLATAPPGLFRFEIGVQTIWPQVLAAINRQCDLPKLATAVSKLRETGNIRLHLDLIAGLPGENPEQFAASLDWALGLRPHHLQLGFLKILPGTRMARDAAKRGFIWQDIPPYEVLASDSMSFTDLNLLRDIAQLLEQYWNSALLPRALPWLMARLSGPWQFFAALAAWLRAGNNLRRRLGPEERFSLIHEYSLQLDPALGQGWIGRAWLDLLRLDYHDSGQKDQPAWLGFWERQAKGKEAERLKKARLDFRRLHPAARRCRIDKFCFDLEYFQEYGQLREAETIVACDPAEQDTCAWRLIMSN